MATNGSPPKPWERKGVDGSYTLSIPRLNEKPTATSSVKANDAPALPARPDSLSAIANRNASTYSSPYNHTSAYSSPYGMSGMGGMGGMGSMGGMGTYGSAYSSPYSRFGGGYGSMYGSGMYGGSPYGMAGYGGMYGAQPGMYGPNGEQSLTQTMNNSTQATFQMIESIVGAFGGFAQMLESTYMATHSSFFAMVSVAEQFGTLKATLGSVLGIFTLMRWIRMAIAKLTGRPLPASPKELTPANFATFNGSAVNPDGTPAATPRPSRKPFIFFVVAVFGLPWLMGKLIRTLAASQEAEQQRQLANAPEGQMPLDPSKLDFCRVLYDYTPQAQPGQPSTEGIELTVKKGELVAVLSKSDPMGEPSEWWRCRARDGRMGYLPSTYLETIQRRPPQNQIAEQAHPHSPSESRLQTMTSSGRVNSMKTNEIKEVKTPEKVPVPVGKSSHVNVESFQKSAFYNN